MHWVDDQCVASLLLPAAGLGCPLLPLASAAPSSVDGSNCPHVPSLAIDYDRPMPQHLRENNFLIVVSANGEVSHTNHL